MRPMVDPAEREQTLGRIREICLALPETSERLSHGAPTFFVREKRAFLMVLTNHHDDGRFAVSGPSLMMGPPGQVQTQARRRLARATVDAEISWWQEVIGACAL